MNGEFRPGEMRIHHGTDRFGRGLFPQIDLGEGLDRYLEYSFTNAMCAILQRSL